MSKLSAFLKPAVPLAPQEFVVSNRFLDENGEVATILLRGLPQEENEVLIKASSKPNKQGEEIFNGKEYNKRLIVACTVEPDFKSSELCKAYDVVDPLDVPARMFLAGEYTKLLRKIMEINGMKDADELKDEAKNS